MNVNNENTRYVQDYKTGTTIGFHKAEDGKVIIGWSFTHPKDNFCRRSGRVKCNGRITGASQGTSKSAIISMPEGKDHIDLCNAVVKTRLVHLKDEHKHFDANGKRCGAGDEESALRQAFVECGATVISYN